MSWMTIEEFRATKKEVENLSEATEDSYPDTPRPGWTYADNCLVIERNDFSEEEAYLILGNCEYEGPLASLEELLYKWATDEGYGT